MKRNSRFGASPHRAGVPLDSNVGGVVILPMGEEEVKVAKSEAPVNAGAWCKRETLRR